MKVGYPDIGLHLGDARKLAGKPSDLRDVAERKRADDQAGNFGAKGKRHAVSSHEATAKAVLGCSHVEHAGRPINADRPARAQPQEYL